MTQYLGAIQLKQVDFWPAPYMCLFFSQLGVQCSVCMTFAPQPLNMCSKLPITFTLFPVLNLQVCPRTIMVPLSSLYPWHCSREKKYQALHTCTTSMFAFWREKPGNKATTCVWYLSGSDQGYWDLAQRTVGCHKWVMNLIITLI